MTNKELYEFAIASGLQPSYFNGEDKNPFKHEPEVAYWAAEHHGLKKVKSGELSISSIVSMYDECKLAGKFGELSNGVNEPMEKMLMALIAFKEYWSWCPAPLKVRNSHHWAFGDYFAMSYKTQSL